MLRMLRSLGLLLWIWGSASILPARSCEAEVRINEILADPGRDWNKDGVVSARDDEWLEIVNHGTTPLSLDDLRVSDAANVFRFGFSGTLNPGAVLAVYGDQSVTWESANGLTAVGLSLNNAGDTIRLWRIAGTDTVLVDEHTFGSHEVLDDRSTGPYPDGGDNWVAFDSINPYTGTTPPLGTGCPPTPGTNNGCPTAVEGTTWSRVKALYVAREPRH